MIGSPSGSRIPDLSEFMDKSRWFMQFLLKVAWKWLGLESLVIIHFLFSSWESED